MSLNCPKCGFQQPEDQYCASCGVDMTKFQPKEVPLWKRALGNWLVQLGLLILVVVVLIIKDNMSSPAQSRLNDLPKLSEQKKSASASRDESGKVLPPPMVGGRKSVSPPPMRGSEPSAVVAKPFVSAKENQVATTDEAQESAPEETTTQSSSNKGIKKKISSFFYLVPRTIFENLMSASSTPAEDGIAVVRAKVFKNELKTNRNEWRKLGSQSQSFEYSQSKLIFVGSQAGDTGARIGYFIRTLVSPPDDSTGIWNIDLRAWSELQPGEDALEGPRSNLELRRGDVVFISNLVPRETTFTEQQKAYFEGAATLRALNDPLYLEENYELILVLQYK